MSHTNLMSWIIDWSKTQSDLVCYSFDSLPSTNTYAKSLDSASQNQLVVTDFQPQGRGRGTNTWISPETGTALLSSWIFSKNFSPQPILSPLVGLALYKAIQEIFHIKELSLKAPNDIYIKDKKLGGVLIETDVVGSQNKIIIGIGLNIFKTPSLNTAECLQNFVSQNIDSCQMAGLLDHIYIYLKDAIQDAKFSELSLDARKELLECLNKNESLIEKYLDILPDGSLKTKSSIQSWTEL